MSMHCRVPQSTLWRWVRGLPERYTREPVRKIGHAYGLKLDALWGLIQHDERQRLRRRAVPLPDFHDIRRGPVPKNGRS